MAALGRQLAALYDASGSIRIWRKFQPAAKQLEAACIALRMCGQIASRWPLPQSTALQLASAAKLVFRGGQAALAGQIFVWRSLRPPPSSQLQFIARTLAENMAGHQLLAVTMLLNTLTCAQGGPEGALAEFADQVPVPEAVLPWLATVSEALLMLPEQALQSGWLRPYAVGSICSV
jgi:hypothetical protein